MAPSTTVSVVIPSYNHATYVIDAIGSVIRQKKGGFELDLIVIDDGSTDGSVELLKRLHGADTSAFRLVTKHNEGLCRTLNRAIREHAVGSHIAVLASDDMWRADKLRTQLVALQQAPDCELCYSNAETFGEGRREGRSSSFLFSGAVKPWLTVYNFVPAGTMLFTRRLFDKIGGFDETGLKLEDWDFLLRASAHTRFCCVRENLLLYRVHSESSLIKMRRTGTLFGEKMKVLKKNISITSPFLRLVSTCLHFGLDRILRPVLYRIEATRS
ncbi:glycosyltransferase family 2 protein [Mesorhizobium sp. UC22_110]|jgi:alpha-1,3-rhamnosyltransferase|uniref:glycosyltransferase family 2 protein n=1 Tax=unclassified Mesorhizobium TaxID=325217 RepID=UPI00367090C2